jgi:5-formyltetrahydrofolate cyclo-ligase
MSKAQARHIIQQRLDSVSAEDYRNYSKVVLGNVRNILDTLSRQQILRSVLSYHAQEKWKEVDLAPLEEYFPETKFDYVATSLDTPMPTIPYDAILVPLYGFNVDGYRLGHGAGWYDKFLAGQAQATKLGVGLEAMRIDFLPEQHDIPLSMIVTDHGVQPLLP